MGDFKELEVRWVPLEEAPNYEHGDGDRRFLTETCWPWPGLPVFCLRFARGKI